MKPWTLRRIKNEIRRLDPKLDETNEAYDVAVILLSAIVVGSNIRRIARFSGLTYRAVTEIGRRLRTNGIWRGAKTRCNWADKENGHIEFWCDVCVGQGYMSKTWGR